MLLAVACECGRVFIVALKRRTLFVSFPHTPPPPPVQHGRQRCIPSTKAEKYDSRCTQCASNQRLCQFVELYLVSRYEYNDRFFFDFFADQWTTTGWSQDESETLRKALMKFGIGNWSKIIESGCLPGKTNAQMNLQLQRLLGQQSTAGNVYLDHVHTEKILMATFRVCWSSY